MKRILVVDDSSMIRALFRQSLTGVKDYRAREVRNGQEALDAIAADGEPDLIFLDVNMPVMDGLEFLVTSAGAGLGAVPISRAGKGGVRESGARLFPPLPPLPPRSLRSGSAGLRRGCPSEAACQRPRGRGHGNPERAALSRCLTRPLPVPVWAVAVGSGRR